MNNTINSIHRQARGRHWRGRSSVKLLRDHFAFGAKETGKKSEVTNILLAPPDYTYFNWTVTYALKFRGTKLSRIANLLNIHRFYFRGCWEQVDMVDHLIPGNLRKWLISNEVSFVFVLPIQYKVTMVKGALFGVHFLQFCSTCSKYSRMVFWTAKSAKVSSCENLSAYSNCNCMLEKFFPHLLWGPILTVHALLMSIFGSVGITSPYLSPLLHAITYMYMIACGC